MAYKIIMVRSLLEGGQIWGARALQGQGMSALGVRGDVCNMNLVEK